MATILCQASEQQVWKVLEASCDKHLFRLERNGTASAILFSPGYLYENWFIDISSEPDQLKGQTRLIVKPHLSTSTLWIRYILIIMGGGLAISGLLSTKYIDVPLLTVGLLLSSILVLGFIFLSFSITTRRMQAMFPVVYSDLQDRIKTQLLEPFEMVLPRLDLFLFMPMLVLGIIFAVAIVLGPTVGVLTTVVFCVVLPSLHVTESRRCGWRGVLHGIQSVGVSSTLLMSLFSIIVIMIPGTVLYCGIYHAELYRDSGMKIINDIILFAFTDELSRNHPAASVAEEIFHRKSLSPFDVIAGVTTVTLGFVFFTAMAIRSVIRGLKYRRLTHLAGQLLDKNAVPSSDRHRISSGEAMMIVTGALGGGVLCWASVMIVIDVFTYFTAGQSFIMPPVGWSLEVFKNMLQLAGLPAMLSELLMAVALTVACLPGLILFSITLYRVTCFTGSQLAGFYRPEPQSKTWLDNHRLWVAQTCRQAGIRQPDLVMIDRQQPMLYSECKIVPSLRGRIVISSSCRDLFSPLEMRALLAHEIHHLKRNASQIAFLKVCSVFLLCPIYYLLILYDFAFHERQADAYAFEVMGNGDSLKSGLVKLYIGQLVVPEVSKVSETKYRDCVDRPHLLIRFLNNWLMRLKQVHMGFQLYCNESIFAAAYPTLSERIQYIESLKNKDSEQKI